METTTIDTEEIEYESAETFSEMITAATYAYQMVESIDVSMLSNKDRKMVEDIKHMALKLVHFAIESIYEVNIEE